MVWWCVLMCLGIVQASYLLIQQGHFSLQSPKYLTFRKKFIDNYDSFFDSGHYESEYVFQPQQSSFLVTYLNTTTQYYLFTKYYADNKLFLSDTHFKNSTQNLRELRLQNKEGLFRNKQVDIQKVVLCQNVNDTLPLSIQFHGQFLVEENEGYFYRTILLGVLLLLVIMSCLYLNLTLNSKMDQLKKRLRRLKRQNDSARKKGSIEHLPISQTSLYITPSLARPLLHKKHSYQNA